MREGAALVLPLLHEGFGQGKDYPGLPHPYRRCSSLAAPQVSCPGASSARGHLHPAVSWTVAVLLMPWVCRELLIPPGREGFSICSLASCTVPHYPVAPPGFCGACGAMGP